MQRASVDESGESNKQSSTCVAFSENSAKFTPLPSHVAPRGAGLPGQIVWWLIILLAESVEREAKEWNGDIPARRT
jgi:hypothetical protein